MTIMHRGFEIGRTLEDLCRPDRMALVVYDMQVGIVSQLEHGPAVVERVAVVLDAARQGGFRVGIASATSALLPSAFTDHL